jgi:nucleoside-diphosphate-sugar epimerase
MTKKIFITGSSGCVGHYVLDELIGRNDLEIHLLCRDPKRLKIDLSKHANFHIHTGDLKHIEKLKNTLKDINVIIHIATDWSDSDYARYLNVQQTHEMLSFCNPKLLDKIIYFSTASILGKGNKLVDAAGKHGSGYVRSKYLAYKSLQDSGWKDKTVVLYPTMVFGGEKDRPFSHITSGIIPSLKFMKWIRFIILEGRFHFIHSRDIARVTAYLIDNDTKSKELVLGFKPVTVKQAIDAICSTFEISIPFRLNISKKFIFFMAKCFRIKIGPWERHCIENSDMSYDVVNPKTYGLKAAFPTLEGLLKDIKTQGAK